MTYRGKPNRIEGTIIMVDGRKVSFAITKEYGYQQWGETDEVCWASLPYAEAMTEAVQINLLDDGEIPCRFCGDTLAEESTGVWVQVDTEESACPENENNPHQPIDLPKAGS